MVKWQRWNEIERMPPENVETNTTGWQSRNQYIITCEKHYILFSYVRFYGKPIFSIYYVNMEENVKLTIKWNEIGKFNEFYFRLNCRQKKRSNGNRVDDTLKGSLSCAWMWPSNVNIIAKKRGRANVRNAAFDVD